MAGTQQVSLPDGEPMSCLMCRDQRLEEKEFTVGEVHALFPRATTRAYVCVRCRFVHFFDR